MLSKLTLTIACEKEIRFSYQMGSAFQGLLMQSISPAYAAVLHAQSLHPYSQYITPEPNGAQWVVCTATEETRSQIIDVLADPAFGKFHLDQFNADFTVTEKNSASVPLKDLTHRFYSEDSGRLFKLRFLTPTAFKSKGQYVFFPDLRLIFRSLMSKYGDAAENRDEADEEMLAELAGKSSIVKYSLRSANYHLEQSKIPGFVGELTIRVSGAQTLANYARFLLGFGEYSGMGVKCAMGMGAMRLINMEEGGPNGRKTD
jgi:CRISPR-associated endoribonuclease Cas6